jgi:hypothetical protein
LAGSPVYIEGPCDINIVSNVVINTLGSPGFLVLVNGTITLGGTLTYFGVIYEPNQGASSGNVLTLQGTATVVGGVNVDGNAALNVGSSGNGVINCTDTGGNKCGDLEYNSAAFSALTGFAGAAPTPNTFRQLPATQ